jgi:mRNA interferase RelE/StbE
VLLCIAHHPGVRLRDIAASTGVTERTGRSAAADLRPVSENRFEIAWTATSRRALTRLPEKAATAVVEFLYGSLAENPRRAGKPLKLGLEGLHSARRGDYRVIYRDDHARQVKVMAIEHRSDVYRPRS